MPFFMPTPFKVKADLYKMGTNLIGKNETNLFHLDDSYPKFITAKLEQLKQNPKHARCYLKDDLKNLEDCLWQLARVIAEDQKKYFEFQETRLSSKLLGLSLDRKHGLGLEFSAAVFPDLAAEIHRHLESLEPFEQLCDFLALCVQEDLVIMHKTGDAATADRAECLLVSLPSHWDPKEKCGLDFGAIHKPVADNAALMKAQGNMLKAMTQKGPFVRYNWSLASTPLLAQNPVFLPREPRLVSLAESKDSESLIDLLQFRMERQTMHAFPSLNRSLFAIRIYQEPLGETLKNPNQKQNLKETILTMSEGMLNYKGINRYKETLLKALE